MDWEIKGFCCSKNGTANLHKLISTTVLRFLTEMYCLPKKPIWLASIDTLISQEAAPNKLLILYNSSLHLLCYFPGNHY